MSKRKHTEAPEPPENETIQELAGEGTRPKLSIPEILELAANLTAAGDPPPAPETRKPRTRLTLAEKTQKFLAGIEAMKKKHSDNVLEKAGAVQSAMMAHDSAKAEQAKFLESLKGLP
jgi:hypothetical protein